MVCRSNESLLRRLAGQPKHFPRTDACHEIARLLIEHMKKNGVERIIRREADARRWRGWPDEVYVRAYPRTKLDGYPNRTPVFPEDYDAGEQQTCARGAKGQPLMPRHKVAHCGAGGARGDNARPVPGFRHPPQPHRAEQDDAIDRTEDD